jgi:hypothetical protein
MPFYLSIFHTILVEPTNQSRIRNHNHPALLYLRR